MEADILVPLAFFAMVFGIVYVSIKRKERRQLIEKGVDASVLEPKRNVPSSMKWGMVFVGIGVGILLGKIITAYTTMGDEASMFSMICLFGGLALVIYYFMERNMEKKDPNMN
jgi:preprotein translocase subunit YajC